MKVGFTGTVVPGGAHQIDSGKAGPIEMHEIEERDRLVLRVEGDVGQRGLHVRVFESPQRKLPFAMPRDFEPVVRDSLKVREKRFGHRRINSLHPVTQPIQAIHGVAEFFHRAAGKAKPLEIHDRIVANLYPVQPERFVSRQEIGRYLVKS